jgi:crotonobetainyl-CoA:carnitine CoA-transferase CaiB-like acyl-CoA transferase
VPGPLDGFRVVDCSSFVSGPIATRILGDQGADVIKVEPPAHGDLTRGMGARRGGMGALFATVNRSKRSVAIDLKRPEGLDALLRLVAGADVFVENFRPGAALRLGVGEPALRAVRDDLIYVSITGFGETGPYVAKRVYDPVIQALSGLADIQRDRASNRPRMVRTVVPDKVSALTAAQAITAALLSRERTGRGQHVRLAMLDAVLAFLWPEGFAGYTWRGNEARGARRPLAQDLVFETLDGFITAGTVSRREWEGFARAAERPEWLEDTRFRDAAGLVAHADERFDLMAEVLRTRSSDAWLARLDAEGVPCAPVLRRREVLSHPQVAAAGILEESEHPHAGPMRQPRPAARFDGTPSGALRAAPLLGEHTDEVLAEAGLDAAALAKLRTCGAVA